MHCQWNGHTLTICSYNDMMAIPINRNFCQLMLKSLFFFFFLVICWEFLDSCFRHVMHSEIYRGKCWSTSYKHNYANLKEKHSVSGDFWYYLKLEMDCAESSLVGYRFHCFCVLSGSRHPVCTCQAAWWVGATNIAYIPAMNNRFFS